MSRHRHLENWVAEANDEFDEESSFDHNSRYRTAHDGGILAEFEPDIEVKAKYYGDGSWYKGWVVDTTRDGAVLISFEGYEADEPQETDPGDIKLHDEGEAEAPSVDLATYNSLVREVSSVFGNDVTESNVKDALARCSLDADKAVAFLLDWIDSGKKIPIKPQQESGKKASSAQSPKKQVAETISAKARKSTPAAPSKGKASPAPANKSGAKVSSNTPSPGMKTQTGGSGKTSGSALTPGPTSPAETNSSMEQELAMLGLSGSRMPSLPLSEANSAGIGGDDDEEGAGYRFDSVEENDNRAEGEDGEEGLENISLVVVGHVDAGKSTLNGHLLCLLGCVDKRLMHKYEKESKQMGKGSFAFAWVLDGHKEERERGVTIDVGLTHFKTSTRRVQLLDAPGHKDFVPNMISGAARADAAVLVIDGSNGEFESGFSAGGQTVEHAVLVRSLGVQQLIVAVNKLDNVLYSQERYAYIEEELGRFLRQAGYRDSDVTFVPCSGLTGENLVQRSDPRLTAWYTGPTLLELIDALRPPSRPADMPLRLCVYDVFRAQGMGVCVSGRIEGGVLSKGDEVALRPGDVTCQVKQVEAHGRAVQRARAGESVVVAISPLGGADLDSVRVGSVLCDVQRPIPMVTVFLAQILTFDIAIPITIGFQAVMYMQSVHEPVVISKLLCTVKRATAEVLKKKPRAIPKQTTAVVQVTCQRCVCLEAFSDYKQLGRFTLRESGTSIAAGTVVRVVS